MATARTVTQPTPLSQLSLKDGYMQANQIEFIKGMAFVIAIILTIHIITLEWEDRTLPLYNVKPISTESYMVEYSVGRYQNETVSYMILGSGNAYPSNKSELILLQGSSAIFPKRKLYYNESYWKENEERKLKFLASIGVFPHP